MSGLALLSSMAFGIYCIPKGVPIARLFDTLLFLGPRGVHGFFRPDVRRCLRVPRFGISIAFFEKLLCCFNLVIYEI